MFKNDRAIDKKEVFNFINNSKGITASALQNIFGSRKYLYPVLTRYVETDFLNKKTINRDTIYFGNNLDYNAVFEIEDTSKAFDYFYDLGFRFSSIKLDEDNHLLLNSFIPLQDKTIAYKFRFKMVDFKNIEEYQTINRDYLDVLVIDDFSIINKIKDKVADDTIIQKIREGKVRQDILIYDLTTNRLYTFYNKNNTKQLVFLDSYVVFDKLYQGRLLTYTPEIDYFKRLYDQKTKNKLKYTSKKRE